MAEKFAPDLDPSIVWDLYSINPLTGKLYHNHDCRSHHKAGDEVKCKPLSHGYCMVKLAGHDRHVYVHQLMFLWIKGRHPRPTVEHRNHIKHDNRWINLTEFTRLEQTQCNRIHDLPPRVLYRKPVNGRRERWAFKYKGKVLFSSTDKDKVLSFAKNYSDD